MPKQSKIAFWARHQLDWIDQRSISVDGDDVMLEPFREVLLWLLVFGCTLKKKKKEELTRDRSDGIDILQHAIRLDDRTLDVFTGLRDNDREHLRRFGLLQQRWETLSRDPGLLPIVRKGLKLMAGEQKARGAKKKKPKKPKKPRPTGPTKRNLEIYAAYLRLQSYRAVGKEFSISHTAVGKHVRGLEASMPKSKSVRAQALPTDRRGQVAIAGERGTEESSV